MFKADEFWSTSQTPEQIYTFARRKTGKNSKVVVTCQAGATAIVVMLSMFIKGSLKTPRCFKNVKQLSCQYRNQRKSWKTEEFRESE